MNSLDVLCAQLTRDLFAIAKFLLTIGRLLLHCWYSLGRPVTIGTPIVLSVFDDWYSVPFVKNSQNSQKTVKTAKITIGVPIVAACCYTLFYLLMALYKFLYCIVLYCTDDACSSSSLSTTVIKFSIFWTPLANFLLSRPNSVEYGKCKTTTLLPSAKCTRPLFQGRTGCGGRPSGWHDIVTCQRLVIIITP